MAIRRDKNYTAVKAQIATIVREAVGASAVQVANTIGETLHRHRHGRGRYYARNNTARKMAMNQRTGELDIPTVMFLKSEEARRVANAGLRGRKTMQRGLRGIGIHRASRPGDPPAVDTGTLLRNILSGIDVSRLNQPQPTARVGTNLVYAPGLEYGTGRVAPRPYFRPSMPKARQRVASVFRTALARLGRLR